VQNTAGAQVPAVCTSICVSQCRTRVAQVLTPGKRERYKVTTFSRVDCDAIPDSVAAASLPPQRMLVP
jgi:hypothetical protein